MAAAATPYEVRAMRRALTLACRPGVPLGPNPRVGCVLISPNGTEIAAGHHAGAGSPHAEAVALGVAGEAARGATAVVTLEPCRHHGRTGPCTDALLAAGVRRVVFGLADPDPTAAGGAAVLREHGVSVVGGVHADAAREANRYWLFGLSHRRPFVTWKVAGSLDGRTSAADGSSRWITSLAARRDVHRLRRDCDTVLVGTGTALADDPALTVRDHRGSPAPRVVQPLRAVMGTRPLPATAALHDGAADTVRLATRDPRSALATLYGAGRRHVLLEGGATLAAAFLRGGLVDEVVAYVAPVLLGGGHPAVGDLGVGTVTDALRLELCDVRTLGEGPARNLRLVLRPAQPESPSPDEGSQ